MFAIGYNSSITRPSSSYGKPFGTPTLLLLFPILNTKNNNDNEGVPFDFPYLRDFRILILAKGFWSKKKSGADQKPLASEDDFLQYLNDAQILQLNHCLRISDNRYPNQRYDQAPGSWKVLARPKSKV